MKLIMKETVKFFEVNGGNIVHVKIPAGTYSVKIEENPSGKNTRKWYVFSHPSEIGSEFNNKKIGADKLWVMNQTCMSVV